MNKTISLSIILLAFLFTSCQYDTTEASEEKTTTHIPESLQGVTIDYSYSEGNSYNVKFQKEGISYQFLSGSKPDKWWGPFEYKYMLTEHQEYFVSWYENGFGDYVTLLINFENEVVYGSAIIANKGTHFQKAKINKITIQ